MKLINILKEIKIYSPIPKFETNAQLASYLKNNPKFREELVDKIVKNSSISPENPEWIPIIQQWKEGIEDENGIFLGTDWNDKDEIFLSSEFDDRLYISINDLDFNIITGQEVPYGPNIFKYEIE